MYRRIKNSWIHYLVMVAMVLPALSFGIVADAAGSSCMQQIQQKCQSLGTNSQGSLLSGLIDTGSAATNAANQKAAYESSAAAGNQAAGDCTTAAQSICSSCTTAADKQNCQKFANNAASNMKTQSDSLTSGAGDLGSMLPMIMGIGAMAAMMAMQQQNQNQAPPPQPSYGALQPNGGLNCAMADSYKYADCDSYLTGACASYNMPTLVNGVPTAVPQGPPVTGTIVSVPGGMMAQPDCATFVARYCNATYIPGSAMGDQLPNGVVTQVNIAGSGEGVQSSFCQNQSANKFCNDPTFGAARQQCSACRTYSSSSGQICSLHPELCLAQNTTADGTDSSPACLGQPAYNPIVPVGATTANNFGSQQGSGATQAVVSGGPVVSGTGGRSAGSSVATTLPQSVGSAAAAAFKRAGNGGISAQGAAREGLAQGPGSKFQAQSVANDYLAKAGGVIIPQSTTVSRGPASDVQGVWGPSVFAMGSQVYRMRCQARKLNNCP